MLVRRRRPDDDIVPSEITDPRLYHERRRFLRGGAALALGLGAPGLMLPARHALGAARFADAPESKFNTDEEMTPREAVTTYNNFYEFSTDKREPSRLAENFQARPWTLAVDGEIDNPKRYDVDELIRMSPVEERIYRLRCVEAWSMVIPWVGIPLAPLISKWQPTSRAKYLKFTTLLDPDRMPGQRPGFFGTVLDWPYTEGLRMDEAMNPLAILGVGLYGDVLPGQNGAPIRIIVPWKYGFKNIKSIVSISFVEEQPVNTWNNQAPNEYGFYANVNPNVDHPRWSQAKERRIGEFLKRDTLMFNGYAEQVAHLYKDMDLARYF